MARHLDLVAQFKPTQIIYPQTTNGTVTSQVITLKDAHKAFVVFEFTQAQSFASVITLHQATNIAAGTNAAGPTCRIWANEDTATTDTLVAKTAGSTYTLTADQKHKSVVFEIDPSTLTAGYDCVYFTMATSSQATNFVSATAFLAGRYQQATPPSAILD